MISSSLAGSVDRSRWGLLAALGAAGAVAALAIESSYLNTMSSHGTSVLAWELARTSARVKTVLAQWGPAGRSAAVSASWIDFAFILGYTGLLLGLSQRLASRAPERRPRSRSLGVLTAGLALAAGGANVAAKVVQLLILDSNTGQPLPALGFAFAVLNYALLAAAILGCIALVVGRRRKPGQR